MLQSLQSRIEEIYQANSGYPVTDFVITDRVLATILGTGPLAAEVEETVLVEHDARGMSLSVFLDRALLKRLDGQDPLDCLQVGPLADLAVVLEGVSHFNYLAWSAAQDKSVTLLELELQAEVDKFVTTCMMALQQNDFELARNLHGWLFDGVRFHESLDRDQRQRYEIANDYAARFCHRIYERLGDESGLAELRQFYRMTQPEKFSHIHSLA